MIDEMRRDYPDVHQLLLVQRNEDWARQLRTSWPVRASASSPSVPAISRDRTACRRNWPSWGSWRSR